MIEHKMWPENNCPLLKAGLCKLSLTETNSLDMMHKQLQAENERLMEVLERIEMWAKAYPLEVFPEPDFKKVIRVLKSAGINFDVVSASNMRHVIMSVKNIIEQALQGKEGSAK